MTLCPNVLNSLTMSEEELVKMLISDIKEVFSTMIGIEDILHLPSQVEPITHFADCVTSMVGMAGSLSGLVSVHTPKSMALKITASMLGMDVTEVDDDVRDALGEVANMVAGSFKLHLARGGADIRISTPSVVTGSEYVIAAGNAQDTISLRFATDDDWFIISVTMQFD